MASTRTGTNTNWERTGVSETYAEVAVLGEGGGGAEEGGSDGSSASASDDLTAAAREGHLCKRG
jgi:hypothetical protein